MNIVNVTSINVLDNPCAYGNPFQFEITFECLQALQEDLDWKVIYVGSAESEKYDQELESVLVGPVPVGVNKFVFQAPAPDATKIPASDLLGVTVVLVTCSYADKEFIRVGYYVNNTYNDPELEANPPNPHRTDLMKREILAQKPRVTRFPISWDEPNNAMMMAANAASPGTGGLAAATEASSSSSSSSASSSFSSAAGAAAGARPEDYEDLMAMEDDDDAEMEEDEADESGDVDLDAMADDDEADLDDL